MKNRLHIAMSTRLYGGAPLYETFKSIALYGVRYVLLCVEKDLSVEAAQEAYKDFSQLGLKCVQIKSLAMPKSYMDETHYKEAIGEIKKLSEIGKIYGVTQLELTAGSFRGEKKEHIDAAIKFIKEACDLAAENGQYCALDFTPKKNQLIKTWGEMKDLYGKIEKDNLLLNINTALLHHENGSDEDIQFLENKAAIIEILDIEDDNWSIDINLGEGIVDIKTWVEKTKTYVFNSCKKTGGYPAALIILNNSDKIEIKRTLKYFERIMPYLRL